MNNRKMLWPYIGELLVLLFVYGVVIGGLLAAHMISVKWSAVSIGFILVIALWMIRYVHSFVSFSAKVLLDCAAGSFETVEARYVEQFTFRSSSFLEKWERVNKEIRRADTFSYKIAVMQDDAVVLLTASCRFPLEAQKTYRFTVGKRSKAIASIDGCPPQEG